MTPPTVAVWPDTFIMGISKVEAGPSGEPVFRDRHGKPFTPAMPGSASLDDALNTRYETAACLVGYMSRDKETGELSPCPLIWKQALKGIEDMGEEIVSVMGAFDFDMPGHEPLTQDFLDDFLVSVNSLTGELANWHSWYATRHGTRLVYVFSEPMPVIDGEARMLTVARELKKAGFDTDNSCSDWTRRFFLPRVVRQDEDSDVRWRTDDFPIFDVEIRTEAPALDLWSFPKSTRALLARKVSFERRGTYPEQQECHARLYETSDKGREIATRFYSQAKKVLKKYPQYYEQLVTHNEPLPDENKHEYMIAMFGHIVPPLIRKAYAKIEDVFALVYEPILAWELASCRTDPHANVWEALQHVFGIEAERYNEEEERRALEAEEGEGIVETMTKGMRLWCDAADIDKDAPKERTESYVMRHMFANIGKYFYPLGKHGYYEQSCVDRDQIITYIRNSHLDTILATRTPEGDTPPGQVINNHSTIVHRVTYLPECDQQGISRIDTYGAALYLPMYRLSPYLTPVFDEQVDAWLQCFFGDNYETACRWIGYALDFSGPICALSLVGPPDTGKKLLVVGLSECLEDPFIIPSTEIGATHNEGLLRSPFLHVNESWPNLSTHGSPSDRVKELTTGDPIHVNPKFKATVQAQNPLRLIFTANNHDLIYGLMRGRELQPEDKEAIGQRLMHYDIGSGGSDYLKSIGGREATADTPGRRWIRGDAAQVSDHVVAKHFLWLHANRPARNPGDRLLVMGNCGSESNEMFAMASQSDNFPIVVRAVRVLQGSRQTQHCIIKNGRLYVTRGGVLKVITETFEERIKERSLEAVLNSIAVSTEPVTIEGREFLEVDTMVVERYLRRWGL